ncbi:hypothetical protein [Streptomyces anandii]|uniref:hypothetical protein n=1 Tax=Streptomyces anandii TaxID=285454 RepID=UPI001672014F|nr:hypothetical protein [Streptomyces anandii]
MQPADGEDGDFEALVEAASAYRLAGQWRLLVERDAGIELLLHAASLFSRAGLTYGAYLAASLAPDMHRDRLGPWTERLLRTAGQRHGENELRVLLGLEEHRPDPILGHVQQQTYLLLACAGLASPGSARANELRSFATESPHLNGVVPVGSMAVPVRTFWGLALDMLSPRDGRAARAYAGTLAELSRAYARTVNLAMANTLTWSNAATPIDVVDLDLVGAMAMGVKHFGADRMRDLLSATRLPDVALVPLDLGMEVADWDLAPPDGPHPRRDGLRPQDAGLGVDDLPGPEDLPGPGDLPGPDDPPSPDDPRGPDLGGL